MRITAYFVSSLVLAAAVLPLGHLRAAQDDMRYLTPHGQNIVPVYGGWSKNADGTFTMHFGYYNRNTGGESNIPIGPANSFDPPLIDRGQPTHFYPTEENFLFGVKVPADWGKKELVWTLTMNGKTEKAYGTLVAVSEVDTQVMAMNMGGGGPLLLQASKDQPPSMTGLPSEATLGSPNEKLTLNVTITDDGIPPPPADAPARAQGAARGRGAEVFMNLPPVPPPDRRPRGLSVRWIQYRGLGQVTFEKKGYASIKSGATESNVAMFSESGDYIIRVIASDSLAFSMKDILVKVGK